MRGRVARRHGAGVAADRCEGDVAFIAGPRPVDEVILPVHSDIQPRDGQAFEREPPPVYPHPKLPPWVHSLQFVMPDRYPGARRGPVSGSMEARIDREDESTVAGPICGTLVKLWLFPYVVSLSRWFEPFQPDCRIVQYDDGCLGCHHCYRRGPEQCGDLSGKLGKEDPAAIRDILECKSGVDMIGGG